LNHNIYIAGAFFNPQQLALIETLEQTLENAGVRYISPRKQHVGGDVGIHDAATACKVFAQNCEDMNSATHVLAVLNWELPADRELHLMQRRKVGNGQEHQDLLTSVTRLSLPDTGTVWEMGYAYATGRPIAAFTTNPHRLNVMLLRCASSLLLGLPDVHAWLADVNYTREWKGKIG